MQNLFRSWRLAHPVLTLSMIPTLVALALSAVPERLSATTIDGAVTLAFEMALSPFESGVDIDFGDLPFVLTASGLVDRYELSARAVDDDTGGRTVESGAGFVRLTNTTASQSFNIDLYLEANGSVQIILDATPDGIAGVAQGLFTAPGLPALAGGARLDEARLFPDGPGSSSPFGPGDELFDFNFGADDLSIVLGPGRSFLLGVQYVASAGASPAAGLPGLPDPPGLPGGIAPIPLPGALWGALAGLAALSCLSAASHRRATPTKTAPCP